MRHLILLTSLLALSSIWGQGCSAPDRSRRSESLPPLHADPFAALPPLAADEPQHFNFSRGPTPPPSARRTETLAFPPPTSSPNRSSHKASSAGPLKVVSHRPEGKVSLVGAVTVTFNQPMIPLSSLSAVAQHRPPLRIEPLPPGRFRWLGTKTVSFEPTGRMPYGTEYTVTVPAGTRSQLGGRLEHALRFRFHTPRPALVRALPSSISNQSPPDTPIALLWNQQVDRQQLLSLTTLHPAHGQGLQLVPPDRWAGLKAMARTLEGWDPARTVVLRPKTPLRKDTRYVLTIGRGLRGEGPRTSRVGIQHSFQTYGPLRVSALICSDRSHCQPRRGFSVLLSNPLVTEAPSALVKVSPEPRGGLDVHGSGHRLFLEGKFAPRTRYTIRIAKGLRDIHGQQLATDYVGTRSTGDRRPDLRLPVRGLATLERSGPRQLPLEVTNVRQARLRMVKVHPEQVLKLISKARYSWDDNGRRDPLKGIKGIVVHRTLATGVPRNGQRTISIATDQALGRRGAGPLYVELRSEELKRHNRYANPLRGMLVQVTDIGLMARYDNDQIVAWVSDMQRGTPLAGARAELRDRRGKVLWQGKSDAQGLVRAPGRRSFKTPAPFELWIRHKDDRAFAILDQSGDDGDYLSTYAGWGTPRPVKQLRMHLFTDRSPYRPKETAHLKGILRVVDTSPLGGVEPLPPETRTASYRVTSPRGQTLQKGELELSPSGSFTVDVTIPEGADLGAYRVRVRPKRGPLTASGYGTFQVQEYRAPEFKVSVDLAGGPHFVGQDLAATVGADYLFGAPMAGASCSWSLTREPGRFRPPNHAGFSFGDPLPPSWRWSLGYRWRRHLGGRRRGAVWQQHSGRGQVVAEGKGRLDSKGRLKLSSTLERDAKQSRVGPLAFTLEAEVRDQNRQSIANRQHLVAHPAARYVGLRPKRRVLKAGQPLTVEAVLVDLEGKRVPGVGLEIVALQRKTRARTVKRHGVWTYDYKTTEKRVGSCRVTTTADVRSCALTLPDPGAYLLRAAAKDRRGRATRTTVTVYATGPGYVPWKLSNQSRLELVADKESYAPGETARVLVKSPLRQGRGLLALVRGGMARVEPISMQGSAQVIEVPIEERHVPGIDISLALARGRLKAATLGAAAKDLGRPTMAHGSLHLRVTDASKRLKITVRPGRKRVTPGQPVTVTLEARTPAGQPARAEVALMVVDEGVLSLLGYQTPDPVAVFHYPRGRGAPLSDPRTALLKRRPKTLTGLKVRPRTKVPRVRTGSARGAGGLGLRGAGRGGGGTGQGTIGLGQLGTIGKGGGGGSGAGYGRGAGRLSARFSVPGPATALGDKVVSEAAPDDEASGGEAGASFRTRSQFATTAYYNPAVLTDAKGRATVTIELPDNTTTYRVMAVALDRGSAQRFGNAEAQVQVQQPLLLRPSLPRFLNVGDRFEASVMVHNQSERAMAVDVLVRGRNAVPSGKTRRRLQLAAHGAREVRFPMRVEHAGPARIQLAAVSGNQTDAVEKQLPVLLPATTEAFATYGVTDHSVSQPVHPPGDALAGYGALELSLSSTALGGLEDAARYLVTYPHECTEQTASRLLPIFSLGRLLDAFHIGKLGDSKRRAALARAGVRKLVAMQRYDGGWGNWQGSRISWPFVSAYATYALLRAREAGESVRNVNIDRARRFLKRRLDHPLTRFGEQYDLVAQVASVWVLSELKQHERAHLDRLYGERAKLPLFARAWLMVALHRAEGRSARVRELLRQLDAAAVQTASAAHFAEAKSESLRLLMHSSDRTDAIVLQALLEVAPTHPLRVKLVRGLMQSRVKGSWSTTQANAFALVALSRYYRQEETVVPDHLSRIWYGEAFVGQASFKGRQLKLVQQAVPLGAVKRLGAQSLLLAKQGAGKLYYRIGLRYAPSDLTLEPEEQGFAVSRLYEPIAGPDGKPQQTVQRRKDGSWQIKAGATVRVRVVLVVPDRRYFVALADPLPAGLEAVNLGFKTSARTRLAGQLDNRVYDTRSWYALLAFDHRELRDDRVVLYADRLPAGVYETTYLARATTLGTFVTAPTKAEEMYRPETFGRTGTTRVHVVP